MDHMIPRLAGQKGLRGDILREIKKAQPITAKELGETFGVSANAVRRHLKELEAEGLSCTGGSSVAPGLPPTPLS